MKNMKWSQGQYDHFAGSTFSQTYKKANVLIQNVSIQIVYQRYIFSEKSDFSKVWANCSHTPLEYFAPNQTLTFWKKSFFWKITFWSSAAEAAAFKFQHVS